MHSIPRMQHEHLQSYTTISTKIISAKEDSGGLLLSTTSLSETLQIPFLQLMFEYGESESGLEPQLCWKSQLLLSLYSDTKILTRLLKNRNDILGTNPRLIKTKITLERMDTNLTRKNVTIFFHPSGTQNMP